MLRSEMVALWKGINSNDFSRDVVERLASREKDTIRQYTIGLFKDGQVSEGDRALDFADTPASRAAVGYQALDYLVKEARTWGDVAKAFVNAGNRYPVLEREKLAPPLYLHQRVVDMFFEPLVDYLEAVREVDDIARVAMQRYKRRCEWFERADLMDIAQNPARTPAGHAEHQFVLHFARYLYDQELEVVLEAQTPPGKARLDLLVPDVGGDQRLVVEAKVHDGRNRNATYVANGIAQSIEYANEFGTPFAYLVVYNVMPNSRLIFTEAEAVPGEWLHKSGAQTARIVTIDLANELPASDASSLKKVGVRLG